MTWAANLTFFTGAPHPALGVIDHGTRDSLLFKEVRTRTPFAAGVRFHVTAHLSLPAHLGVRGLKNVATERRANRAILFAARLLGVAAGTHLSEFRGRDGGYQDLKARLDRAELLTSIAWRVVSPLHVRLRKVPDRHRPHYSPAASFEILEIRNLLGWNQSRAADQFLVADNTIGNWERERSPESRTVGSLAKPVPPVTRMNDVTRHLVQMMARFRLGGAQMIASHLTLAGFRIAEKTVRNAYSGDASHPFRLNQPEDSGRGGVCVR